MLAGITHFLCQTAPDCPLHASAINVQGSVYVLLMDNPFHYALQSLLINAAGSRAARRNLESHRDRKGFFCSAPSLKGCKAPTQILQLLLLVCFLPPTSCQGQALLHRLKINITRILDRAKAFFKYLKIIHFIMLYLLTNEKLLKTENIKS